MPRRKPDPVPTRPRKQSTEFKYHVNYEYSSSIPCVNKKCHGFMFMVIAEYIEQGPVMDELECFVCKRIRKLGPHDPNRMKPVVPEVSPVRPKFKQ